MGVVINCMGKGKEGSQTYNLYIEVYTQLERGEKNNDQHRYGLRPFATGQLKKSTSDIRISLGLTYTLMAKWQWKRIPVGGPYEWNSLLASSCQPGVWDFEGAGAESLEGVYSCRQLLGQICGSCLFDMIICSTWTWFFTDCECNQTNFRTFGLISLDMNLLTDF